MEWLCITVQRAYTVYCADTIEVWRIKQKLMMHSSIRTKLSLTPHRLLMWLRLTWCCCILIGTIYQEIIKSSSLADVRQMHKKASCFKAIIQLNNPAALS
jgi:hypothetical protein